MASNFGFSGATPIKHDRVAKILPWFIKMSAAWIQRTGGRFWYIEANAGPGAYIGADGGTIEGSPILGLRTLHQLNVPFQAELIERNVKRAASLSAALNDRSLHDAARVHIHPTNNQTALKTLCHLPTRSDRGIVFFDPKGAPDFALIDEVMGYPEMQGIDVLVNVPTSTIKLMRKAARSERFKAWPGWLRREAAGDVLPLCQQLHKLHKRRVLVGNPAPGRLNWSLILGSNYERFRDWPAGGMYAVDTPAGQDCLRRISFSADERDQGASA